MKNLLPILFLFLFSCISLSRLTKPELMYNEREGHEPELQAESIAKEGDVIYTEYSYRINPAVRLSEDLESEYANVSSKIRLSKMLKDNRVVYGTISISDESITYLFDEDDDGKFDQLMVQARKNAVSWKDLKTEAAYEQAAGIRSESGGFEIELLHEGFHDNRIEITYNEYRDDLTQVSFAELIGFELTGDGNNILSYKGIEIEIIEATEDQLTYKVLSGSNQETNS